jgi:hypothetical protein
MSNLTAFKNAIIVQYVRRKKFGKNLKVGVLFAVKSGNNKPTIYWSKCRKEDKFNREQSFWEALHRPGNQPVALSFKNDLEQFKKRCSRYFKCSVDDLNIH